MGLAVERNIRDRTRFFRIQSPGKFLILLFVKGF